MHVKNIDPSAAWLSISIALKRDEVDTLIKQLEKLRSNEHGHFHFRTDDFNPPEGIADFEWSIAEDDQPDNMKVE